MSSPDPQTIARLDRAEFVARFIARVLTIAGPTFEDGTCIEDYARETASSYFDEQYQEGGDETPEEWAATDVSYWEH